MKIRYIIIPILTLFILFSGCIVEKTIIINADNYSKNVIQHVLDISDKNITKYIDSITVYEDQQILNEKCKDVRTTNRVFNTTYIEDYAGCVGLKYTSKSENASINSADIYILSDTQLKEYCDSEGNTVSYFIGFIEYSKKYTSISDGYLEDLYSKEYAKNLIKNKCDTDEYLSLYKNYEVINNKNNIAIDKYNLAVRKYNNKWDYYIKERIEEIEKPKEEIKKETSSNNCFTTIDGEIVCLVKPLVTQVKYTIKQVRICNTYSGQYCGIPENRYYEYTNDYNSYSKSYDEYSKNYDKYSAEYDNNTNIIKEYLKNYIYPFEYGYQEYIDNYNFTIKHDIIEQITEEKHDNIAVGKMLYVGESWELKNNWIVTVASIDASNNMVWIVLSKDGIKKDDYVIKAGEIYTYNEIKIFVKNIIDGKIYSVILEEQ